MNRTATLTRVLALFGALTSSVAFADPQRLAVVPLGSAPDMTGLAGLLTQEIAKAAAGQPDLELVSSDQVAARLGPGSMKRLMECGLKSACASAYLDPLGVQRAVLGTLDRDEVHYLLHLELIDIKTAAVVVETQRTVLIASRELESQVAALAPDLIAGHLHGPAHLTLVTRIPHIRVTLDDRPLGELPVTVELSPGKHEIKTEKKDYLDDDRYVELGDGESKTVDIELTLMPNRYDSDQPIAAVPPPNAHRPEATAAAESGTSDFPWAPQRSSWVALSVGVAALAVAVPFAVESQNLRVDAIDPNSIGVLSITRAQVLRGRQDAAIADACYATAGMAAIVAGLLYVLDGPSSSSSPSSSSQASASLGSGLATGEVRF
jgi:hypothetical protein